MGLSELISRAARAAQAAAGRRVNSAYVIYVSDLVYCPARALNALLGVEEAWLDEKRRLYSEYYALLGSVFHKAVSAFMPGASVEVPVSLRVEEAGLTAYIHGRADLVVRDTVVEVKTSNSLNVEDDRLQRYLLQAGFYASVLGAAAAVVVVFNRIRPECAWYSIRGAAVERARRLVEDRARAVLRALAAGGEEAVRIGTEAATPGRVCEFCPYARSCKFNKKLASPLVFFKREEVETGLC